MDNYLLFGLGAASFFICDRIGRLLGLHDWLERLAYRLSRKRSRIATKWADNPRFHPLRCIIVTGDVLSGLMLTLLSLCIYRGETWRRIKGMWAVRSSRQPGELLDALHEAAATHGIEEDRPNYRAIIRVREYTPQDDAAPIGRPDLSCVTFVHTPKKTHVRRDQFTTVHLGGSEMYVEPHKPNSAKRQARQHVEAALGQMTIPPEVHTLSVRLR